MKANEAIAQIKKEGSQVFTPLKNRFICNVLPRLQYEFNVTYSDKEIDSIILAFFRMVTNGTSISIKGTFEGFLYRQQRDLLRDNTETFVVRWAETLHEFIGSTN